MAGAETAFAAFGGRTRLKRAATKRPGCRKACPAARGLTNCRDDAARRDPAPASCQLYRGRAREPREPREPRVHLPCLAARAQEAATRSEVGVWERVVPISRALELDVRNLGDGRHARKLRHDRVGWPAVDAKRSQSPLARPGARHGHERDVHVLLRQKRADASDDAGLIGVGICDADAARQCCFAAAKEHRGTHRAEAPCPPRRAKGCTSRRETATAGQRARGPPRRRSRWRPRQPA